jgi:DNA polymerase-3 subunit epsilon
MRLIGCDIETSDWGYPCEIAFAEIMPDNAVLSKSWLVKPSNHPHMSERHQQIHGITVEELENAPTLEKLWPEIKGYFQGSLIIAHNAAFDIQTIIAELKRYKIKPPALKYFCTCNQARRNLKLSNYRLDTVCYRLGIEMKGHHRAEADAVSAAKIYMALSK